MVMKDNETKMIMAMVVPSKGVGYCAVGAVKKMTKQPGYEKVISMTDSESVWR